MSTFIVDNAPVFVLGMTGHQGMTHTARKLTAGSKGKGTGIPAVYQSCFARVERLLRDGRVDACRFDGFHNKGGAC